MLIVNNSLPGVNTVDSLTARLRAQGFTPGPPPHVAAFGAVIDQQLCLEMGCSGCDNRGLECRPFRRGRRYRVLAVCLRCGHAEEF